MSSELKDLILDVREQVLYLQELGVDTFDVQMSEREAAAAPLAEIVTTGPEPRPYSPPPDIFAPKTPEPAKRGVSRLAQLPSLSKRRSSIPNSAAVTTKTPIKPDARLTMKQAETPTILHAIVSTMPEPIETIDHIRAEIGPNCTRCKLSTLGRTQVVNSTGNFYADLMFVGEAPGADEDLQGFPFVGRAGQLLTDIIEKGLGIPRKDVFIGNINRCRPPGNRAPETDETIACKPFLQREIAVVRPKVIVVLGATAAQNLLETKVPIGKLRGHFHDYLGAKVMPTFHPAYLLRDPHKKREVWEDMKLVMNYLRSGE
ncbi:hypothetical protein BH10ACI3_BH10ACI3_07200 [soil metagenome]